jgi:subtilisin family serine protease
MKKRKPAPPDPTGRVLVLLADGLDDFGIPAIRALTGPRVACSADFAGCAVRPEDLEGVDAMVLDKLGVAIVQGDPGQIEHLRDQITANGPVLAVEPVRVVRAISDPDPMAGYLRGYRDGVTDVVARFEELGAAEARRLADIAAAEKELAWGLSSIGITATTYSGKGIKVAILDTGFDHKHPDFPGREVAAMSFVKNEDAQDLHGHGTHCIGTACGPKKPFAGPRYGIAHEAVIHAGKVLNAGGEGDDQGILAGINWAVTEKCRVISMSLGAAIEEGEAYSKVYEKVAKRALKAGTLIVAAAGNESERPKKVAPVGHPANCPSILAVGAVDAKGQVAYFSNRGLDPKGGQVDIAAPGVEVLSAFPMPFRTRKLSGTSMATPHVSGVAALLVEANPTATALEIWSLLTQTAKRLPLLASDIGAGLLQAP